MASREGSATGRVRRSRLLTNEKIAVLAPMPSASESSATTETTGVARSDRNARRTSAMDVIMSPVTVALTREVSEGMAACELTHLDRVAIEVDVARAQHAAYEAALLEAGYTVERLPAEADIPDSVFIEDIAVVFDELAIITRPGAVSRRWEIPAVADALAKYRRLHVIEAPGTMDGGDVLVVGRRVFVGCSTRTNVDAINQMRRALA